jgi:hypothetical protein
MLRLALYLDRDGRAMRVATVDDPKLVAAASRAAVDEAHLRAAALAEVDADVAALQRAEAVKLETFFEDYLRPAPALM